MRRHKIEEQAGDLGRDAGWSAIVRILRRYRWHVAAIGGATVGVYVSSLSIPILIQNMIDGIAGGTSAWDIGWLAILALLLSIADVALADIRRSKVILLGQRVDRLISLAIMAAVLGARIDVSSQNIGEILNRTEQTGKIKDFLIDIIPSSIFDIGGVLIAATVIFYYNVYCGLATALIAAGGVWYSKRVLDTFYTDIFAVFKLHSERQGNLAETVNGLPTIKALAMERGRFRHWGHKTKVLINAYGKTRHIIRRFFRGTRLSQRVLTLTVVCVGGVEMMRHALSVGELFAIVMLTDRVSSPLLTSADLVRQFQEVGVAVKELGSLLSSPQDRANVAQPVRAPLSGGIIFQNVTYRYSEGAVPAITDLSLELPRTGLIAIIGRNGSGKSTLLRLMQGLLRDFEGDVLLGGIDVRSYHPRWLRSQMAVVNQDTVLFAGTVKENIAGWTSDVSDADIEAALKLAGAIDFVDKLPEQVNTCLAENAANLSAGQRQRHSVARAVLRDPKIVLLDEPTAFLDAEAA